MTDLILQKFQSECATHLTTHFSSVSSTFTDKPTSEYYRNEYKRCVDEQMNFVNYINEQIETLNTLQSCEIDIERFLERLKAVHQYELKQQELFEQVLHELTTINPSSKDECRRLFEQIDELILSKSQLTEYLPATN